MNLETKPIIRRYEPSDRKQLMDIFKQNVPSYFDKTEVKDFEAYLEQNAESYFTIEQRGIILGGTGCYVNKMDHSGRITWIFFHPESVGHGLGTLAVEHCLAVLKKEKDVEKFIVTTSQLAYKFFEKFGFKLSRMEKDHWGKGLDLYEMEMQNVGLYYENESKKQSPHFGRNRICWKAIGRSLNRR